MTRRTRTHWRHSVASAGLLLALFLGGLGTSLHTKLDSGETFAPAVIVQPDSGETDPSGG